LKKAKQRVKICCISSAEEVQLAIKYGANALGFVGPMPSGPGIIDNSLIAELVQLVPPGVTSFLLTSETEADKIISHYNKVNTTTIQLVDAVSTDTYAKLKSALPAVKLVQVIHVKGETSIDDALQINDHVDAILLDSGNPNKAVKELGGTGRVHNWDISRQIVEAVSTSVYLAGGLHAENVQQAIETVRPFGVDLCSGVRTDKKLDEDKLASFMSAVR
jgi:phosphoribosylanthranilate isomerase